MPFGIRQRDPNTGAVLVETTTRLPRIMGRVDLVAGQSGYVDVPPSGTNPIFYWFNASNAQPDYNASPRFTDDSATTSPAGGVSRITWQYVSINPLYNRAGVLVYGRY